jgi:STE24 endopeptidase
MQFLLLICLMMVCLPLDWPAPPFGAGAAGSALLSGLVVLAQVIAAGLIARAATRRVEARPEEREAIARRYAAARNYFFFVQLAAFALCLWGLGWGRAAWELGRVSSGGRSFLVPGGEMLVLAPFLLAQLGAWAFFFDADRAFHTLLAPEGHRGRFWSRGGYVAFLFRQQLILVFAPLFLLMGQQGLERLYPEIMQWEWLPLASLLILPTFLVFFPLFLPPLLGLRPMPAGPVRARLEANARRLRFRYSQIYLWDTRGGVANAMIVGVVPWLRFVVLTDRLLEDLTDDEVDAVFGHEVGHARHGHILYYMLFLMLSFLLLGALVQEARSADEALWRESRTLVLVAPVAVMAAYMFAVFGYVSRRCERQADLFGCRAVSCSAHHCGGHDEQTALPEGGSGLCAAGIDAFIRALRRVEDVNGLARDRPRWRGAGLRGRLHWVFRLLTGWLHTWQHSTIPKRTAFLERVMRDPAVERRFQRRVWLLRWAIALSLAGALAALGFAKGWDVLLMDEREGSVLQAAHHPGAPFTSRPVPEDPEEP